MADYLKKLIDDAKKTKKKKAPEDVLVLKEEMKRDLDTRLEELLYGIKGEKDKKAEELAKAIPEKAKSMLRPEGTNEEMSASERLEMLQNTLKKKGMMKEPTIEETREVLKEELKTSEIEGREAIETVPTPQLIEEEPTDISEIQNKKLIDAYDNVRIFQIEGEDFLFYTVPVPKAKTAEKQIITTIQEAATRIISVEPYKIKDPKERRNVYYHKVLDIIRAAPELNIPKTKYDFYAEAVVREMVGYGIIDEMVRDEQLEEIMVIGPKHPVYVFHREFGMMKSNVYFYSDNEIMDVIGKIAREVGRRIDISSPLLDARLPDGSRVNATIPPASISGSTITIRKFRSDPYSVIDLLNYETINEHVAAFLWLAVEGMGTKPANILISGGTGSGKTTFLNVLASFIPRRERIISIEDTAELNLPLQHLIKFETRPPGLEGTGEIPMDTLTKNSLRMRPDRIIVGEIRHAEAFSLFTAMNTGHDGSMGTIHANSSDETIVRLTNPPMSVPEIMVSALDLVILEHRIHDKRKGTIRRITEIAEVTGGIRDQAKVEILYKWDPKEDKIVSTGVYPEFLKRLSDFTGLSRKDLEKEIDRRSAFLRKLQLKNIKNMKKVSDLSYHFLHQDIEKELVKQKPKPKAHKKRHKKK